ncbi:MAG: stage II sporulation protein M [Candidatus Nezhaarchaeota archaeon]|nr:stage II sporulation protein M [Candidatus Nezhaarchaeota archaeon]
MVALKGGVSAGLTFISLAILAAGIFIGYSSAHALEGLMEELSGAFLPLIGVPAHVLALAIFVNNFSKTLVAMLLGVVLAVPPMIFVLVNGFILGAASFFVVKERGLLFLLAGILPHGVLEIPALALSCALGIRIGISAYGKLRGRNAEVKSTIKACLKTYFKLVAPLLLLAAFIEAYVTPMLLEAL